MSFRDYIPIGEWLSGWLGELAGKFRPIPQLEPQLAGGPRIYKAAVCEGTCMGTCTDSCTGGCKSSCRSSCRGGCSGSCRLDCKTTCKGNCKGTCTGYCSNYCKTFCQTYCQYAQVWSENNGLNHPSGSGRVFSWSTYPIQGNTIVIPADDWNTLANYIEDAGPYCGGSVSLQRAVQGNPITATIWNNLNDGLGVINYKPTGTKYANVDLIKASETQALADAYNTAKITSTLPTNNGSSPNLCCQSGMYDHATHLVTHATCQEGQIGAPRKLD